MRVAITGASGFIGNRIVETFHLGGVHEVVPVVHSNSSLALPARFRIPWRVCNHSNVAEMTSAFEGCEVVVHAAFGSPLKRISRAVYRAADRAGVRRLVVLSSASVYNQNPAPGITEDSPLPTRPATSYNAAKIAADRAVRALRAQGQTEVAFLMPGVVYGPRSQWIMRVVQQVTDGTAYLVNGGTGIFNGIYVDNLVQAVRLSIGAASVDGHAFFVSDAETVTWADFYGPIAHAAGVNPAAVRSIPPPPVAWEPTRDRLRERLQGVVESTAVQRLKPHVPRLLIKVYKAGLSLALSQPVETSTPFAPMGAKNPDVSLDMSLLQQSIYKLPNAKAERVLGYRPLVPFEEGMQRSIGWLKFAGYPLRCQ